MMLFERLFGAVAAVAALVVAVIVVVVASRWRRSGLIVTVACLVAASAWPLAEPAAAAAEARPVAVGLAENVLPVR